MSLLLLFFDGVGVGVDDADLNPFAAINAGRLAPVRGREPLDGCRFRPLETSMGVPGLPQSATNQTTLYTGVNAAGVMGRHLTGVPGPTLWPILEQESLFLKLVRAGRRPTFANAYSRAHLEGKRPRWSASTRMVRAAGVPLRMIDPDERRDRALPHDYRGEWARHRGLGVKQRTAAKAAAVLVALLADHDLVLYEYFLTDLVAHRGTVEETREQARRVEALVDAVLSRVDPAAHTVVVFSDHGNLEDGSDRRHTRNPAPLLAWGRLAESVTAEVTQMTELTPVLSELACR